MTEFGFSEVQFLFQIIAFSETFPSIAPNSPYIFYHLVEQGVTSTSLANAPAGEEMAVEIV